MDCASPSWMKGNLTPCRQCLTCRINARRVWQSRLMLESYSHEASCFVTLTYTPEEEEKLESHSLNPRHAQLWLKKLRKALSPSKIRHFTVGEYGDDSLRPHFHSAVFGMRTCIYGRSRYFRQGKLESSCCPPCDLVRTSWGRGGVHLDELNPTSAGYICGYVTKKYTARNNPALKGRTPEFARMSNRPGIGAIGLDKVAAKLLSQQSVRASIQIRGAVPSVWRTPANGIMPFGKYLTERFHHAALKKGLILPPRNETPELQAQAAEMRALWRREASTSAAQKDLSRWLAEVHYSKRGADSSRQLVRDKRKTL